MATIDDFNALDVRVGQIVAVRDFPEARKPAYVLTIDFGEEVGIKQSSAQLTVHYTKESLQDKQVLAVVNLPPRQIGPIMSQCLTLGTPDKNGDCILLTPDENALIGGRLY